MIILNDIMFNRKTGALIMQWEVLIGFASVTFSLIGLIFTMYFMQKESARETKDFHGRLCALEERYIQMMERIIQKKK